MMQGYLYGPVCEAVHWSVGNSLLDTPLKTAYELSIASWGEARPNEPLPDPQLNIDWSQSCLGPVRANTESVSP